MSQIGDRVIYRVMKHTARPGARAKNVYAAPKGEHYNYEVDKFWLVANVLNDGRLLLVTRRGKQHVVAPDDPKLRRARWWERLVYQRRFPKQLDR